MKPFSRASSEITSPIPPAKMFHAFVLEADNLIPKLVPQAIMNVEILQGEGGPGSIKRVTFAEGCQFNHVKYRVDSLDRQNLKYSYSVIEGDVLNKVLENISNEIKFEACPEGGSLCKSNSKYYTVAGYDIKEEQIKAGKERTLALFKAVEAYLLEHPDAAAY